MIIYVNLISFRPPRACLKPKYNNVMYPNYYIVTKLHIKVGHSKWYGTVLEVCDNWKLSQVILRDLVWMCVCVNVCARVRVCACSAD